MSNPFSIPAEARKIDPSRGPLRADGTALDNDRIEIGPTQLAYEEWQALGLTLPDLPALREYRLERIRGELRKHDYAGVLLWDPLNIRYATDSTNMQLWVTHNPCRACFIATDGPVVLWDFHNCEHLSAHLPLVDELRHGASLFYFEVADRGPEIAAGFAAEVDALLRAHGGGNRRLAVDKMELEGIRAFEQLDIEIMNGQEVTEFARHIKNENELNAMRCAIAGCEAAMAEMRAVLKPDITENALWAELHRGNIIRGGEWIETRLLASGPRTNPWFAECGPRVIQDGDIVAFDTDLIGAYGYCSDLSRTWLCGDGKPTEEQKFLYRTAYEHIQANMALLKPGVHFSELTEQAHRLPEDCIPQRYGVLMHGVGLCDEYPSIRYREDYQACGYDGVLKPGMVLCVEAYVGRRGGAEGVKLEDQVVITETGFENLTNYPFEADFLS